MRRQRVGRRDRPRGPGGERGGVSASPYASRLLPADVQWSATWRPLDRHDAQRVVRLHVVDDERPGPVRDRGVGALARQVHQLLEERAGGAPQQLGPDREAGLAPHRRAQHVAMRIRRRGVAGGNERLDEAQGGGLVHVELGREDGERHAAAAPHRVRIGLRERVEDAQAALE